MMQDYSKNQLLKSIMETDFAVLELSLYLDTHPNDVIALNQHNKYAYRLRMLKNMYEQKYGPLSHYSPSAYPWRYIMSPWPWEIRY